VSGAGADQDETAATVDADATAAVARSTFVPIPTIPNAPPATDMIERVALDPYQFVRDAYLQRRELRVLDGESPR
jgi:ABC-type transporter lipoprotein component MlaA